MTCFSQWTPTVAFQYHSDIQFTYARLKKSSHSTQHTAHSIFFATHFTMNPIIKEEVGPNESGQPVVGGAVDDEHARLQEAMRTGDRATIRAIMNARQERTCDVKQNLSSATLDPHDFSCSICRSLLYKPCANQCGHFFCFWCLHKSMSAVGSSSCPVCRNPFTRFGAVCEPLQRFLCREFPKEMKEREEDVKRQEVEEFGGARSPRVEIVDCTDGRVMARRVDVADILCCACQNVPMKPVVPSCGHICCLECISSSGVGQEQEGEQAEKDEQLELSCPECQTPLLDGVGKKTGELAVCSILQPLLQRAHQLDEAVLRTLVSSAKRAKASKQEESSSAKESKTSFTQSDVSDAPNERTSAKPELLSDSSDTFVHFGIGCDGCGVYPIVGRAFHCVDCPEAVGYDLCHSCIQRGIHTLSTKGRFDQTHRPEHGMEEREQVEGYLHILMAANPTLTPEQVMIWVEMQMNRATAAADEEENDDNGT